MKRIFTLFVTFFIISEFANAQLWNQSDWNKTSLNDFGFYNQFINKYHLNLNHSWDDDRYPWNRPDRVWTNILLPWGNVGIGTLTPDEKLHVVGNVKIEGRLFVPYLATDTTSITNLTVTQDIFAGRNIFAGGSIGIGVNNPTQKLDIAGSMKVSNAIYSDSIITNGFRTGSGTFSNLNVNGNLLVSGNTGFGVAVPTEKLDIAGNLKVSKSIFSDSIISNGFRTGSGTFGHLGITNDFFVSGKTGLGVTAPQEKLEVAGNIKATQNLLASGVMADSASFAKDIHVNGNLISGGSIGIGVNNPTQKLDIAGNMKVSNSIFSDSIITNGFRTGSGTFGHLGITNDFFVSGKTGLGVTAPQEKLEVAGNIKATQNLLASGVMADSASFSKGIQVGGDLITGGTISSNAIYTNTIKLSNGQSLNVGNDILFGGNAVMNQTLAIGTTNVPSGYLVAVKGKIIAEEIKVRKFETWPDYVFEKNYKLRSITELGQYIQANQHLPGIPSSKQVETEGVSVGEMQAKLLEKIEELTLYVVELQKQNEKLAKKVEKLENQGQ
jgi:hypothetical protein